MTTTNKMTIEDFKWTDELVKKYGGWLFTFGMRPEDKIREFKQAIIKETNNNENN